VERKMNGKKGEYGEVRSKMFGAEMKVYEKKSG
jgi:hypothetical protein